MRLNVHCGCGFHFGTDGIGPGVDDAEVDRLIELVHKDNLGGTALIMEAARKHVESTHHVLQISGEIR